MTQAETLTILFLILLNTILQIYDCWSTIKIKKGPDGKIGTKDDGIELNSFMEDLQVQFGVVRVMVIKTILAIIVFIGLFYGTKINFILPIYTIIGLALLALIYLRVFAKNNFKHDGI